MSKENESKVVANAVDSKPPNSEESNHRPEKVMVPFFEGDQEDLNLDLRAGKMHPRRSRFNKSDNYHPKNRSSNSRPHKFQNNQTKEVGANSDAVTSKHSQNFRSSNNPFKPTPSNFKNSYHHPDSSSAAGKIAYIDKSNVGNIRPLSSLYTKPEVSEPPRDLVTSLPSDFRPEFTNPLEGSFGQSTNFVDALIRNSNSLDGVVLADSTPESANTNKSQQLKSVLTKMGILEGSRSPKEANANLRDTNSNLRDLNVTPNPNVKDTSSKDVNLKELNVKDLNVGVKELNVKDLEKDMEKHYVFPKYMTSPDPSSIPIPGSL